MATSITSLKQKIAGLLLGDKSLKNVKTSCIVKKVSSYDYKTYVDIVDPNNETISIHATINADLFLHDIDVGDRLSIVGSVNYYKDISFCIKSYTHEVTQKTNYVKVYEKLSENKILDIPVKPIPNSISNIAIISSAHASGLKDFLDVISSSNLCNVYIFHITLQGNFMESQFLDAMEKIKEYNVDTIIVIRGGGAKVDLEWFDNYEIAKSIKLASIPVICGIGHETDHTIVDICADKSCTTPTQVSYFIKTIVSKQIAMASHAAKKVDDLLEKLSSTIKSINMVLENHQLTQKDYNKEKLMQVFTLYNSISNDVLQIYHDTSIETFINSFDKSNTQIANCEKVWNTIITKTIANLNTILESHNISMLNETTDMYIRTKEDYLKAKKRNDKICIHFIDGTIYV